ncbi:TPA: hypothetical protein DCR79_00385 [Patescibacteria group bacterium]|nr:hypothetical protein [Patescibacteria group bacterium]
MNKQWFWGTIVLIVLLAAGFIVVQKPGLNTPSNNPTNDNASVVNNSLDLSNKGLTQLPRYVLQMTNLEKLDLSNNQLTGALPAEIRQLKNLKILDMSDNLMTGIPAEIGQLSNLQVLDLSNNKFTGLPYELGNLKKLQILNLSGNQYAQADLEVIRRGLPASVNIITD